MSYPSERNLAMKTALIVMAVWMLIDAIGVLFCWRIKH